MDIFGGSSDEGEHEANHASHRAAYSSAEFDAQMALAFDSAEEDAPIETKLKSKKHQRAQNHVMDSDQGKPSLSLSFPASPHQPPTNAFPHFRSRSHSGRQRRIHQPNKGRHAVAARCLDLNAWTGASCVGQETKNKIHQSPSPVHGQWLLGDRNGD